MILNNIICPVSEEKVDENVTRLAAFIVIIFMTAGLLLKSYQLVFIITIDFIIRALTTGRYSYVRLIAKTIAGFLKLKKKPIDAAPKKFAAGLGALIGLITGISIITENFLTAYLTGSLLIFCAALEGLFSICLGCHIYSYVKALLNRKRFFEMNKQNEFK